MEIERGDSIVLGEKYCQENSREDLNGKTVKLTPQYFEDENGIYSYFNEYPGVYNEENEEAESIYHLFRNNFENFKDCELIKGTSVDREEYEKIIRDQIDAEEKSWLEFMLSNTYLQ